MSQVFQRPVRRVNGPVIMVERRVNRRLAKGGNFNEIPRDRIPLHERTGMLHVRLLPSLEIHGPETGEVFPLGIHYRYETGCSVCVEVLPRGVRYDPSRPPERPPFLRHSWGLRFLRAQQTPVIGMAEPEVHVPTSGGTDAHVTILPPKGLYRYLSGVLPYIGVDPVDVSAVRDHITTRLERGKRQIAQADRR